MTGLTLVTARRVEDLARQIAEDTREGTAGPLSPEWIAIPGPGLARWLAMRLAEAHGVCAAPTLWFPRKLLTRAMQAALGDEGAERSAFDPESLTWAVAGLLPEMSSRPGFDDIAGYLDGDTGVRLVPLARRIAETLDDYLMYRPDLIRGWETNGGEGGWQAELWRELVERHGRKHLAARIEAFAARLADGGAGLAGKLPGRVSFFAVHSLPELLWRALEALALRADVRIYLPGPEPTLVAPTAPGEAGRLRPVIAQTPPATQAPFASGSSALADETSPPPGVPLGQALCAAGADLRRIQPGSRKAPDTPGSGARTRLERIQERQFGGLPSGSEANDVPVRDDSSLTFHACPGALREVQVLHDRILACLDEMPDLDASGIGILTPDPDLYAPLIRAVFEGREDARRVPTASVAPEHESRAAQAFWATVRVLRGRFAVAEVIDLLEFEPLRARFGLQLDDLAVLRERLPEAGIRWGVDAEHRRQADLPADPLHTWRSGLDRLLLGWAGTGDPDGVGFGGVAPLESLDDEAGRWLGPLAELLGELADLRVRFGEARDAAGVGAGNRSRPRSAVGAARRRSGRPPGASFRSLRSGGKPPRPRASDRRCRSRR